MSTNPRPTLKPLPRATARGEDTARLGPARHVRADKAPRRWRTGLVAGAVLAAMSLLAAPTPAQAATYSTDSISAALMCSVRSETLMVPVIHNRLANDGYRDWLIYEWYRYDGVRWISDGWTTWSYNNDVTPSAGPGLFVVGGVGSLRWYEYATNVADPMYRRAKPAWTVVAAKVWFLNGADGNYYVSWAQSETSLWPSTSCRVLGEYCNGYICVPSSGRLQSAVVSERTAKSAPRPASTPPNRPARTR